MKIKPNQSKDKTVKETELRLKKLNKKLRQRIEATDKAMIEAKKISTRLTELEKL